MIETREQWEYIQRNMHPLPKKPIVETIEALRSVARAADAVLLANDNREERYAIGKLGKALAKLKEEAAWLLKEQG